jgi:hypothetical protein
MWLKKYNPGSMRYLLRLLRSRLRILVGLITGHCPLNKHLYNKGLIDEPICIACGMEDESAWLFICYVTAQVWYLKDSFCLFVSSIIFQILICVVHIRPDLWSACEDFISPTFPRSFILLEKYIERFTSGYATHLLVLLKKSSSSSQQFFVGIFCCLWRGSKSVYLDLKTGMVPWHEATKSSYSCIKKIYLLIFIY